MNILPLVSLFILLFGLGAYGFFHNAKTAIQEQYHIKNGFSLNREIANSIESAKFQCQEGEHLFPKNKKGQGKKEVVYRSPRLKFDQHDEQKLNLRELSKTLENPTLTSIALTLIQKIYAPTILKINEEEVLNILIRTLRENPSLESFEELYAALTENDRPFLYKLIKGTQNYQIQTGKGYPALGDFLSIHPDTHKKPIYFSKASYPLLESLFGRTIALEIVAEENRKWDVDHKHHPFTKKELEELLSKHSKSLANYESLLDFSSGNKKKKAMIIKSPDAKMQIKVLQ